MRRFRLFGLLLAVAVASGQAEDRRTDKTVLSVMTLNAEFLWDGVSPEEGSANFPWKFSQTEAEEHMRRLAEIIARNNPDIVNLVEVENIQALTTFNDKFLTGRGYRPFLADGIDTQTGQDVALLTRIDPESMVRDVRKGQSGGLEKSVSKNYVAKLDVGGTKIAMIGLHFLAFPLSQNRRLERQAQADAIRSVAVEKKTEGFSVIVLGDFNDYDGEQSSADHRNSLPISNVLSRIRGMDSGITPDDLVNAASVVPKANRFTAFHDANQNEQVDPPDELTSIDHVLLAPELAAKLEFADIPHGHDPRMVTDHFPVVVRLRLQPPVVPAGVRLTALLPNPAGDENQNEAARLKNFGGQAVDLHGWKLKDSAGRVWSLDALGSLQAGEEKTIQRRGQSMAMNNRGDTIDLVNPSGNVVQTVTYGRTEEGEEVLPQT